MKNNNYFEKANFRSLIETDGKDRMQDRLDVIDVFLGTEEHITLDEMFDLLMEKGHDFDPVFVTQCMNRMVELGFAQKKQFEGQPIRYEHRHLGKHHDHLICTKCKKIVDFRWSLFEQADIPAQHAEWGRIIRKDLVMSGICRDCLEKD